jgi:hypothetical protein
MPKVTNSPWLSNPIPFPYEQRTKRMSPKLAADKGKSGELLRQERELKEGFNGALETFERYLEGWRWSIRRMMILGSWGSRFVWRGFGQSWIPLPLG